VGLLIVSGVLGLGLLHSCARLDRVSRSGWLMTPVVILSLAISVTMFALGFGIPQGSPAAQAQGSVH
jgi:hypothetical protein